MKKAYIYFEDLTLFKGFFFVKNSESINLGEMVFNTSSSGYEESLTDPSYNGQFLLFSFPEIGIYPIDEKNYESKKYFPKTIFAKKFNLKNNKFISTLKNNNLNAIMIDEIRELTLKIRKQGCLKTIVSDNKLSKTQLKTIFSTHKISYKIEEDLLEKVTHQSNTKKNILIIDFGCKKGIIQQLKKYQDINLVIIPYSSFGVFFKNNKNDLKEKFSGVILSNGPGNPEDYLEIKGQVRLIMNLLPTFGICLGHQIMSLVQGCEIIKLKFGHHGINHPVTSDKKLTYITSQNHNYSVCEKSIPKDIKIIFRHTNDQSIAGLKFNHLAFSVQFHPEANPGPNDTQFLFNDFILSVTNFHKEKVLCGHISMKNKKSLYWGQVPLLSARVPNLIMQEYNV